MKNTSELYFNGYESTNYALSSASTSSVSSTIPKSRGFTRRNHGGPQQGERGLGMEATNDSVRRMKFPWVGWLL
jgi:hypothetical protein